LARSRIAAGLSFEDLVKERGPQRFPTSTSAMIAKIRCDRPPRLRTRPLRCPSGDVSQPVARQVRRCSRQDRQDRAGGSKPSYESVASDLEKRKSPPSARAQIGRGTARQDGRRGAGGGRQLSSKPQKKKKWGLTAVTVDAVDRSGRLPERAAGGPTFPAVSTSSLAGPSTAMVGVDNDPIQFQRRLRLVRRSRHHARSPRNATSMKSGIRSRRGWAATTRSPGRP